MAGGSKACTGVRRIYMRTEINRIGSLIGLQRKDVIFKDVSQVCSMSEWVGCGCCQLKYMIQNVDREASLIQRMEGSPLGILSLRYLYVARAVDSRI